eukprot:TRINITY_DN3313_c2_g2_i2.p1 TRINITY_DN3313_c2_g2~~TRINITY_DN3313_c2_g2_i2.p1  ORF type:complete len:375 (+),score=-6.42 TRINITY_DN3313_c2_g2_i2:101-1126(+)
MGEQRQQREQQQQSPPKPRLSRAEATERALAVLAAGSAGGSGQAAGQGAAQGAAQARDRSRSRRDAVSQFAAEAIGSVMTRRGSGGGPGAPQQRQQQGQRLGQQQQRQQGAGRQERRVAYGFGAALENKRDSSSSGGLSVQRKSRGSSGSAKVVDQIERFIESAEWTAADEQQVGSFLDFLDASDALHSDLHDRFTVAFEPEWAMEDMRSNPMTEAEEQRVAAAPPSLEEVLTAARGELMRAAGIDSEADFQDCVQSVLSRAHHLESLVEAYTGPRRLTAAQENAALETAANQLPPGVAPEAIAFTKRALLTLQNNPSWSLDQKKRMLSGLVRTFAASAAQ